MPDARRSSVTPPQTPSRAKPNRDHVAEGPTRPAGPAAPQRARGVPTWLLSVVGVCLLGGIAVGVLLQTLGPPTPVPGQGVDQDAARGAGGGAPGEIRGTVSLRPGLEAQARSAPVLFIIVRDDSGSLIAVTRVIEPRFPLRYRIGPEDAMMPGTPLQGSVQVSARLSQSGRAGPAEPGDLEGEHPGRVSVGEGGADIVLSRVR